MRDIELYRHLLGLELPWTVKNVDLDVTEQRVDVYAEHPKGEEWPCPVCGDTLPGYDHSEERIWRHLESCHFLTFLHASPPRVKCPKDGILQVRLPWAEPKLGSTRLPKPGQDDDLVPPRRARSLPFYGGPSENGI